MKWKPSNFRESLVPLRTTYALIGHGIFYYPFERRHPTFSFIYAITVTASFYVVLGFTLNFIFRSSWFSDSEEIFLWIIYTNVAIAALAQILSWYYEKSFCLWVEKISKIDDTLQKLGATFNYARTFNMGFVIIIFWIIIIIFLNSVDFLWLINILPVHQLMIVCTVMHHPVHMNSIVAFNFSMAVRIIGMRYRKANELLEKFASPFPRPVIVHAWQSLGTKLRAPTLALATRRILNVTRTRKDVIQTIKHVHLELSAISNDLNRVFGVQIALELTAYFVMLTLLLYDLYTIILKPSLDRRSTMILVLGTWFGTYFTKLILINHACESVSAEARRTQDIIHRIHNSRSDPELPDEIRQFSLQIMHHPLFFNPAGVSNLGSKFVGKFLVKVTTYLMILMQMREASIHQVRHTT